MEPVVLRLAPLEDVDKVDKASRSLMFVISDIGFFLSHRLPLALEAKRQGFRILIAAPEQSDYDILKHYGFSIYPIDLHRRSRNLVKELRCLLSIFRTMRKTNPDVVHLITAKPIFYGGLSARLLGTPTLAALTGMGYAFTHQTSKARALRVAISMLYRAALNQPQVHALFQNCDDLAIATESGFVRRATTSLIGGSGTDLKKITPKPQPVGPPIVLMPCRMLRDKGVVEFVEAARLIRAQGIEAEFRLLGDPDPNNPTSLNEAMLEDWVAEGVVNWHRHTSDMDTALANCNIVALPSYREGFPKTLIDAAAAGRAAVATDVPGCRDAVIEGVTGLLCEVRSAESLANALAPLLVDPVRVRKMGLAARTHAEAHFDIRQVERAHIQIYEDLVKRRV
ncbi:MAG: glycosyltransferase family 4 protein [Heliomarina sp.]|uniref:glycosyltransferase family 4 protein n=1 Tax=Heliomarina sp. TaxID=2917556 RepID=UPI004059DCCB